MTSALHESDNGLPANASGIADSGRIPVWLSAEYDELILKRGLLRAELEQARDELASLKAKGQGA